MLEALFWVAVGAVVGWHFPEPAWMQGIKEKLGFTKK